MVGAFYTISSTSVPFWAIAQVLNSFDGVDIKGMDGSLKKGFAAKKIHINSETSGGEFLLENLVVDYHMPELQRGIKVIHIKNINIDKLVIIGTEKSNVTKSTKTKDKNAHSKNHHKEESKNEIELIIDRVSIKNVVLKETPRREAFSMEYFGIEHLIARKGAFEVKDITLKSSLLDVNGSSEIRPGGETLVTLSGQLKKHLVDFLKRDLSFSVKIVKDINDKMVFSGSTFNNKLTLKADQINAGSMKFNDLNFTDEFENKWPITWIDGELIIPGLEHFTKKDRFKDGKVMFMANDKKYELINETLIVKSKDHQTNIHFSGKGETENIKVHFIKEKDLESRFDITYEDQI
jgi:hypothetical protein